MISETRAIELTIRSATDLKNLQKFGKEQRCYAVAYIYTAQRQATDIDSTRGINPIWDAPLTLTCYEKDLYPDGDSYPSTSSFSLSPFSTPGRVITIEIYCKSKGYFSKGDKQIGTVVVPLHTIASAVEIGGLAMTFDVHRPSGRVQGKLNLTVRVGEKQSIEEHSTEQMPSYSYYDKVQPSSMMPPIASYNVATGSELTQGVYHDPKYGAGVVDGVDDSKYGGEVVTGYPAAAGYAFAPLGNLPRGSQSQPSVGQPVSPARPLTRKERKRQRRAQKDAMDPLWRAKRNRRRRNLAVAIVGGIIVGLILL